MKQISLFFMPILAFFLTCFSTNLMGQCYFADLPLVEQQSLTDLYNATNGSNWTNNTNWGNYSVHMNLWHGISVINCSITKIELSSNNLSGSIPNFNLSNLEWLSLKSNQLSGSIPNFDLPNLQYLFLVENQLSGSVPNFNLPNLQQLFLYDNQLSGSIPNFNLPNLQQLSLFSNQLSGSIPNFNLPNLQGLSLYNNQLSGNIPDFNLPNLQGLSLGGNQLSGGIPNFNMPSLRLLYLYSNQLSGSIPNFNLPSLRELYLYDNQLSGSIPEFQLPKLRHLSICPNNFVGAIPTFQYCHPNRLFSSSDFTSCVDTATPAPPTVTVSNITNQGATLSWTSVPNVTSYVIQGQVVGASNWQTININATTKTFSNLQPCKTYQYKVCGRFSNNGYTTFSAVGNFTTTGCGNSGKTTDLEMPTNLTAQQIGDALQIQYTTDTEETATLQLYNSMGQMVEQMSNVVSMGENEITMPFSGQVTAGVYLLQIHTPTQHRTLRVSLF